MNEFCNIIIHVGTNDIFTITSDNFRVNINEVIREIRTINVSCRIILSAILPRPVYFKESDSLVHDFNLKLQEFSVAGYWNRVSYMASYKSFYDRFNRPIFPLFHKIDRLHLNHAGIQKLVHFVANTLAHLN